MQASARLSSSATSRRVIADVSGVITRSCYRTCRWKAHAAALSGQEPPKGQKRISNNERRVQMKEFIETYKASNDGKYPTAKMVRQHVGGCHYTVRNVLQEVIYNHANAPLDKSQAAQPQEIAESAEGSRPEEDNGSNSFIPKSFNGDRDIDDALLLQKDSATNATTIEKTGIWRSLTPDSSRHTEETEAAKQVSYTADVSKNTNDLTVSGQIETDHMKTEASMSLGPVTKSELGNNHGETEATELHLNNIGKFQKASEPISSYQTKGDKVVKENIVDREGKHEIEHQGSTKTSILGSLKSFASGVMNFWKNL